MGGGSRIFDFVFAVFLFLPLPADLCSLRHFSSHQHGTVLPPTANGRTGFCPGRLISRSSTMGGFCETARWMIMMTMITRMMTMITRMRSYDDEDDDEMSCTA